MLILDPEGTGQLYKISLTSSMLTSRENEVTSETVTVHFATRPIKPANFRVEPRSLKIIWTGSPSLLVTKYKIQWKPLVPLNKPGGSGKKKRGASEAVIDLENQPADRFGDVSFTFPMLSTGLTYEVCSINISIEELEILNSKWNDQNLLS